MIFCIRKPQVTILLFSCLYDRGASAFLGQTYRSRSIPLTADNRAFFHSTTSTSLHKYRHHQNSPMHGVKKENLPSKICVTCGRPFTWRKKWEKVWDEVTTCSKSCNRKRRESNRNNKKLSKAVPNESDNKEAAMSCDNEIIFERQRPLEEAVVGDGDSPQAADSTAVMAVINASLQEEEQLINDKTKPTNATVCPMNHDNIIPSEMTSIIANEEALRAEAGGSVSGETDDPGVALKKALRKAEKKAKKAAKRAQREGRGDPTAGQKQCDMCGKSVSLLIRCMYEPNQVVWKMVCGKCWNVASGGVVDGDAEHPHYRYGGLWENRRAQKVESSLLYY